ncbi:uncharacterized protein Bfra_004942 [Botrytis fragariae]|uniref:Uncharacterized protein n=1 Tax=Botrytis fragariae TaxID=1964551 RepID=A0A8H6EIH8_9HELO|nr:uncharacterized protein Bfra_004942 [Botrytis fragariae]KAF5873481.1 hypothetical protein Bfra_004942 [Botrytis fragariae]
MAKLLEILCLFAAIALVASAPVRDLTWRDVDFRGSSLSEPIKAVSLKRDTDYVRNPLSDWDTPLPVRDDEAIEPVPQADLKH